MKNKKMTIAIDGKPIYRKTITKETISKESAMSEKNKELVNLIEKADTLGYEVLSIEVKTSADLLPGRVIIVVLQG